MITCDSRPAYQKPYLRLPSLLRRGTWQRQLNTLNKSISRFARNTVDSLQTIRKLKEHVVEVFI